MASFAISTAALTHIHKCIADEHIEQPLIAVVWEKGQADLLRNSAGQAIWKRETPHWIATVIDLAETGNWPTPVTELHGLKFSLLDDPVNPRLNTCTLEFKNGKLIVDEKAI